MTPHAVDGHIWRVFITGLDVQSLQLTVSARCPPLPHSKITPHSFLTEDRTPVLRCERDALLQKDLLCDEAEAQQGIRLQGKSFHDLWGEISEATAVISSVQASSPKPWNPWRVWVGSLRKIQSRAAAAIRTNPD